MNTYQTIIEHLKQGHEAYVEESFYDIRLRLKPSGSSFKAFARRRDNEEVEIDHLSSLVVDTMMGGTIISQKDYEK